MATYYGGGGYRRDSWSYKEIKSGGFDRDFWRKPVDDKWKEEEEVRGLLANLANLLAEERVTLVYGNFKTAMFDLERRVVYMPRWVGMGKSLRLMLVSHETGHARHTPKEMFHDANAKQYPRLLCDLINICDDDRNDRFQCRDFPGLKSHYQKGYEQFYELFKAMLPPVEKMTLGDRLNLASKCGFVHPFVAKNPQEQDIYVRFKTTITPEQVIELAKEIYALVKQEREEREDAGEGEESGESSQGEGEESGEERVGRRREPAPRSSTEEGETEEGESEQGEGDDSEGDDSGEQGEGDDSEGDDSEGDDSGEEGEGGEPSSEAGGEESGSDSDDGGKSGLDDGLETERLFREAEDRLKDQYTPEVVENPEDHVLILKTNPSNLIKAKRVNDAIRQGQQKSGDPFRYRQYGYRSWK